MAHIYLLIAYSVTCQFLNLLMIISKIGVLAKKELQNLTNLLCNMNVFAREKELIKLFKTKESVDCAIVFEISAEMLQLPIYQ